MNLQTLPTTQLKPAPYNPRITLIPGTPAWNKLERSLNEFELVQPIVWNQRTGHIVSGHQRLTVLKHHGVTEVECAVVDLSLEREKALNITLNNKSVGSDWDSRKLIDLVSELQDLPDFDATLTGFDDQQLIDLILAPSPIPFEEEEQTERDGVRINLHIPKSEWTTIRPDIDTLLETHPNIEIHIQYPQ